MRKVLRIPEYEFFLIALATFGEPYRDEDGLSPSHYMKPGGTQFERGFLCWCKEHPKGKTWMFLVQEYGEAKARAGKLYYKYCRWYSEGRKRERNGPEEPRGDRTT